ncbi:DMT family transporter [Thiomicrorhabdus sediminis]|uniref:DMT family transporter n=1 Tax=Thiomicrorhabdus sediminis TaxID=2580412 RepID=A0A4P9K389_9GAMM|nr:DMT family transporter [Thiomicrorhabdus sediminis]QCU89298.1 DMT family transporter [Thiomicrorhabdus sediminis]
MTPKHLFELFILSALWGGSFLFMRIAAPEFGSFELASLHIIIGGLVLLPIFVWMGRKFFATLARPQQTQTLKNMALVGFGNMVIPFSLFTYAALHIEAGLMSIVNATTPLWGAAIGALLFAHRLPAIAWFGLLIGFIGVIVVTSHQLIDGMSVELLAILAVVGATLCYGIFTNYSKKHLIGIPPLLVASGTLLTGGLMMLPVALWFGINDDISLRAWLSVLALGGLSTGFAFILFFRLLEQTRPSHAMLVTYLVPIFGVLFGNVFLDESFYINMLFGGLLILTGVMLTAGLIGQRSSK